MSSKQPNGDGDGPPQAVITIAALAAGLVAQRVVSAGWRFIRGSNPTHDDSPLPEILAYAAVSAAAVAMAKGWATHRTAKRFAERTL